MRIALVGTDSSHTDKFVARWAGRHELLVAEASRQPGELTADPELAAAVTVVDTVADLVGRIDGAVVGHRRADAHRAAAVPLLEAGIPVYVDKPLAGTVADATAIIDAGVRGRVPLMSSSAVRWATPVLLARATAPTHIRVAGPADPHSEYGGVTFYGVHVADVAVTLLGQVDDVQVGFEGHDIVTHVRFRHGAATLVLTPPELSHGFRLTTTGAHGALDRPIELRPDYMNPVADLVEEMFVTGISPQSAGELLDVVRITAAMAAAVANRGASETKSRS